MTIVADRYIVAQSLSEGWLDALRCLSDVPSRKVVHLLVRILDPTAEDAAVRAAAQELVDDWNAGHDAKQQFYDVETTRNTIFPAAWARRHPEPADLAAYYRERYTKDGLLGFTNNGRGTYFGRIVAHPRGDGQTPGDQLTNTVRKLRDELRSGSNKSSRYEINIYNEELDTSPMSFPCLAHVSVHLHEGEVHMQAVYRNEYLIGRAYGNYLGLAELQRYIAVAAGAETGELLMTINHAELDGSKRAVATMLSAIAEAQAT